MMFNLFGRTPLICVDVGSVLVTTESEGGGEAKEGMFPGIFAASRGLLEVPYNSNLCHYDTVSLKLQCHCGKNVPCSGLLERDDVMVSHTEI